MSAFTVSEAHIQALITWATSNMPSYYHNGKQYNIQGDEDKLGQMLWDENWRSVNHRYNESGDAPVFRWRIMVRPRTPVEIIKACHCLDYQSCETDDYEETHAHSLIQSIIRAACHKLPGYDEAAWGIYP